MVPGRAPVATGIEAAECFLEIRDANRIQYSRSALAKAINVPLWIMWDHPSGQEYPPAIGRDAEIREVEIRSGPSHGEFLGRFTARRDDTLKH